MSSSSSTAPPQQNQNRGLISTLIALPFHLFGVLCGSLLLSITIECLGMHFFWPEEGWQHASNMLSFELAQLSEHFTRSAVVQEPGRTAHQLVQQVYEWIFVKGHLADWIREKSAKAAAAASGAKDFRYFVSQAYIWLEKYLIAAAFITLVVMVRLLILVLASPLFLLSAFIGLVDGLVRRDIRRFGAGRESGFVYHRAKASVLPLAVLPWVVYLALPISVNPLLILLPGAIMLGLAVNIMAGSFKKYL
ncbi:TIGR03747 family integrating conjugative element membrane protein [Pseudomonas sp. TNT2022 ID357]|uniref:TIGR03747 family integrating conjugative element membrane protein n=1 Tax=Pseudomonas idahonensis TaxID=2942628 RepID=A0ABT5Q3S7_9PSED|nr:TIGR03747 family integrating conjugative element membrane protein [Pseudomonas idahonensis]MDD1148815.1 TIGR03747 family integrating conjugative element membrane protein [Pseudomonas idahonensis]